MIFDSEEQKKKVIALVASAPVKTTVQGVISGPAPWLVELMASLEAAHVRSPTEQTVALIGLDARTSHS